MRASVHWRLLGVVLLTWCGQPPAAAAPRVTQRLDNVTLHEALRYLHAVYGWELTGAEGQGRERYEERPTARRASFDWQDAAPGRVLRDVARGFDVSPKVTGRGSIAFLAEPLRPSGLMVNRDGLVAILQQVRQVEERSQAVTASTPEFWRSVSLGISLRPTDGDSDAFYGIERLRAQDDQGNEVRAVLAEEPLRRPQWVSGATADEWPLAVQFIGLAPRARRLVWVEGDAIFYRNAESHRLEMPLGSAPLPATFSMGPVQFRSAVLQRRGNALEGSYVVAYPRDVEVTSDAEPRWGYVVPWARLKNGSLVRLPTPGVEEVEDPEGLRALKLTLDATPLPDEPVALLWDLVARSQPERRVPFRFANIPLPIESDRTQPPTAAPGSGSLRVQLRPGSLPWNGEVAVGLARKSGATWGPIRWSTVEAGGEAEARLDSLAPGIYRVHLTFRLRDELGRLSMPVPLKREATEVAVKPNAAAVLRATR